MSGRLPRVLALFATAGAALALATAPAAADGGLNVTSIDASTFPLVTVTATTDQVASSRPDFTLRENGQLVPGVSVESPNTGAAIALLIDASHTMRGEAIFDARSAARSFSNRKRQADQIAVYTFGKIAQPLGNLSSDQATIESAIEQVGISDEPGTALNDAVVLAASDLANQVDGRRVMIILSDGQENASKATAEQAKAAAREGKVVVYGILLPGSALTKGTLKGLTDATGGRLFETSSTDDIRAVYAEIGRDLQKTFRLQYQSPAATKDVKVTVSSPSTGSATASYEATGLAASVADGSNGAVASIAQSGFARMGLLLAVGLAALLAGLALFRSRPELRVKKRIDTYTTVKRADEEEATGNALGDLFTSTERMFGQGRYFKKLATRLEHADLALRPAELFYVQCGLAFAGFAIATLFLGFGFLALGGAVVGAYAPYLAVGVKANRRKRTFEGQLPDALLGIAASLRAGHSFAQAIGSIVKDGDGPVAREFARVENETRLGRPTDQALTGMADRLGSANFEFVVIAVNIQRQVGGSLAEILDMVADTVRNREQFARKVKALTAMGRASAYVLIAMPFFLAGLLTMMDPEYMTPLWSTSTGHMMLGIALSSIAFGTMILRKMVNFKY